MLLKNTLKRIVLKQQSELSKFLGIKRFFKIKLLSRYAIIISGVRRCGKSTLARQFLKDKKHIYYLNFEDIGLSDFKLSDFERLEEVFKEELGISNLYFFDEIQNIEGWEKYIRQLIDNGKKVLITGSNASMLSKELGTKLTGRHITKELYPFSYKEFLSLKKKSSSLKLFNEYLKKGGFPEYLKTDEKSILKNLFQDIIYRDIIVRNNLRNEAVIKKLINYLVSNIGNEISYNKLKIIIGVGSVNTIIQFMEHLENSYLIFSIKKFDYSYKKQLRNPKKIYCIDNGIIGQNAFSFSENYGILLENQVFIELKRRGYEVYYHKEKRECDFIVQEKSSITKAIQITKELKDYNKEREIEGILEAMNKFNLKEGLILTENQEDEIKVEDKIIRIIPVWKWLLEE